MPARFVVRGLEDSATISSIRERAVLRPNQQQAAGKDQDGFGSFVHFVLLIEF